MKLLAGEVFVEVVPLCRGIGIAVGIGRHDLTIELRSANDVSRAVVRQRRRITLRKARLNRRRSVTEVQLRIHADVNRDDPLAVGSQRICRSIHEAFRAAKTRVGDELNCVVRRIVRRAVVEHGRDTVLRLRRDRERQCWIE